MYDEILKRKTVFELKFTNLILVIISMLIGGVLISASLFDKIDNGYIYAAMTLLSGGTLLLKSRKSISIN